MATGAGVKQALEAIVLAAGSGVRFGGRKLLAPYDGGVLLDGAMAAAFAAPVRTVTVVTGAEAEQVEAAARAFAARRPDAERLRVVHAAQHAEGMGASLRTGVASLPDDTDAAFVFLGDMPRPPHSVLARLAQAVAAGAVAAAPVFHGRRGNPVILGRSLFQTLRSLSGDAGARHILQGLGAGLALVDSPDDGVLFDVDEPKDLEPPQSPSAGAGETPLRP